jgi:hypothetical protein
VSAFPKKKLYQVRVHSLLSKENKLVAPTGQSEEFSVMFWGAFTSKGLISLVVVLGKTNTIVYKLLLIHNIAPFIKKHKNKIFMQDNAPVHKSA